MRDPEAVEVSLELGDDISEKANERDLKRGVVERCARRQDPIHPPDLNASSRPNDINEELM